MSTTLSQHIEQLSEAHRALMNDLRSLRMETGQMPIAVLHSRLLRTKRDLTVHFQLEEENGYLDSVRTRDPNLSSTIDSLAGEHRKLLESLEEILGNLNQPKPHLDDVREQLRHWVHGVRAHEIRENDLIQDAFLHDFGAGE